MDMAYLLNQRLNWYHRRVAAKTTCLLIRNLLHHDTSMLQGWSWGPRLSVSSFAFVRSLLLKLFAATTAEIHDLLCWQSIGELQEYWVSTQDCGRTTELIPCHWKSVSTQAWIRLPNHHLIQRQSLIWNSHLCHHPKTPPGGSQMNYSRRESGEWHHQKLLKPEWHACA
jgi:hypothetical protein